MPTKRKKTTKNSKTTKPTAPNISPPIAGADRFPYIQSPYETGAEYKRRVAAGNKLRGDVGREFFLARDNALLRRDKTAAAKKKPKKK